MRKSLLAKAVTLFARSFALLRVAATASVTIFISLPSFSATPPTEKEVLCKTFVEKAIPDYAKDGLDGVINKNKGKEGLHCKPLFPIPAKITEEQFLALRYEAYRSCLENNEFNVNKIKELITSMPKDC